MSRLRLLILVVTLLSLVLGCGIKPRTERQPLSIVIDRSSALDERWTEVYVMGMNDDELREIEQSSDVRKTIETLKPKLEREGAVWTVDFRPVKSPEEVLAVNSPMMQRWKERNVWGVVIYAIWPPDDREGELRSISLDARDWHRNNALKNIASVTFLIGPEKVTVSRPIAAPIARVPAK